MGGLMDNFVPIGEHLVAIDKGEYERLVANSKFLENLRAAGVDNWDGYHYGYGLEDD